jgi:hypothetical protein
MLLNLSGLFTAQKVDVKCIMQPPISIVDDEHEWVSDSKNSQKKFERSASKGFAKEVYYTAHGNLFSFFFLVDLFHHPLLRKVMLTAHDSVKEMNVGMHNADTIFRSW